MKLHASRKLSSTDHPSTAQTAFTKQRMQRILSGNFDHHRSVRMLLRSTSVARHWNIALI